ncbi:hypothetical protein [Neokomagataea thailandica]|uniref:Lipoprotein n=1 Tax=Neokomagataea tanensis NBRC 106556 TaxID=1223519 RepID=A0ABQ0QK36_9PROT|nr:MULTISPECIES: hypothetical protein [Neokomagataea]GBR47664.1 hypothetical protein AA106556_1531 [Neokomagataea tanensis NBRC 106556]
MSIKAKATAALVLTSFLSLTACESAQQVVSDKEDHLAAAGFVAKPANTPERLSMLKRLPAHRFLRRINGDTVNYVYSDPTVCDCLYVGSQDAYGRYQQYQQQQNLADEQQMTAQEYNDANWNWGAWGGWGPGFGMGPGFGPGFGGYGW